MPSPTRTARLATALLAGGLLTAPLAGCSGSESATACSGTSCTVTLVGDGASVRVLGSTLAFGGVQDGRATLRAGDASVSCAQGESVSAGPFSLTCTEVTDTSVKLTAKVG
jgi:hypothetical protein